MFSYETLRGSLLGLLQLSCIIFIIVTCKDGNTFKVLGYLTESLEKTLLLLLGAL